MLSAGLLKPNNVTDGDFDTLDIKSISSPANGAAVENEGQIMYTPNTGFAGIDTFTYTVEDGFGGESTATVTVTVTGSSNYTIYLPIINR